MQLKTFLFEEMKLSESETLAIIRIKNGYRPLNEKILNWTISRKRHPK